MQNVTRSVWWRCVMYLVYLTAGVSERIDKRKFTQARDQQSNFYCSQNSSVQDTERALRKVKINKADRTTSRRRYWGILPTTCLPPSPQALYTTYPYILVLVKKLSDMNLPPHLIRWIAAFLFPGEQRVKVGDTLSELGYPNGGMLRAHGLRSIYYWSEDSLSPLQMHGRQHAICNIRQYNSLTVFSAHSVDILW